jgi:hypothetical protein
LPSEVKAELEQGYFYALAGNPSSANVWEIDLATSVSRQITTNPENYGVSWMSASLKGVVLADARTGVDVLARFSEGRIVPLREGHAGAPVIAESGQITYVAIPNRVRQNGPQDFRLMLKNGVNDDARVLYEQELDLGGSAWGPENQVAVVSAPGVRNGNGASDIVVLDASTSSVVRRLRPDVRAYGQVVWTASAPVIAVAAVDGQSKAIGLDGTQTTIPDGWSPRCWSPAGDKLIVARGANVGVWRPTDPGQVRDLGASPVAPLLNCSWLSGRAAGVE